MFEDTLILDRDTEMYFFIRYVGLVIFCLFLAVFFFSIREVPLQIVLFVGASLAFFDRFKQNRKR
ncbi:MAG: hypothetical protein CM15mP58_03830 [Burkholderiaceae bacterium]|nr:MAG: hypothetical protein CM15mP58_03830 [Burkholderiaceae bacterium]